MAAETASAKPTNEDDRVTANTVEGTRPGAATTQERSQLALDDSSAVTSYANFCRVTGTPEEVVLDLGMNDQPFGTLTTPVRVSQRLIVNYYTAKRLLAALSMTVQRHERAFGVLETDVQKRLRVVSS